MSYIVTFCRCCGLPAYFKEGRGEWRCPYCNRINEVDGSNVISKVDSVKSAIVMVQELKAKKHQGAQFKRASELP